MTQGNVLKFEAGRKGAVCRVSLIGSFRLQDRYGEPIAIQGRRTRALLGYLLLAPQQDVGRERLAGLFWGDRTEAQSRSSLRQCLLELRGALAGLGDDLVIATRETVALAGGAFGCDVTELRDRLAGEDWREAERSLGEAGAAPLLEGLELRGQYTEWLDATRAEIDTAIADGVARHVERCEVAGDWAGVKALANAWLRRDSFSEPAIAAVIRAELASGSRAAAHIRYQAFKAQLAAEIGVEPGPLVEAALRGEAAFPVVQPPVQPAPAAEPAPIIAFAPAAREILLAVLAFDNQSSDPDLASFCDGVSEEIQRTVASGAGIKVVARASSFQFRGADKAVANVCAALGATHLLDGSVRRSGSKVRISAELVECSSHSTLWAERFDGDLEDVFALQDNIAERVAQALELTLAPQPVLEPLDPATYELFLRARGLIASGDPQFDDTAHRAVPLLEAVVSASPNHAPAWELLAIARAAVLRSGRSEQPFGEGRAGAVEAAETALRLDPRRGGAYGALALLEPWGAHAAREKLLRHALEINPRDPAALTDMSNFCWGVGRFRDALAFAEAACELNPLMPAAWLHVAQMRAYVGDYDASITMLEELHARWPDNVGILMALLNWAGSLGYPGAFHRAVGDIRNFDGWQARDLHAVRVYAEAVFSDDAELKSARVARYSGLIEKTGTMPLSLIVGIGFMGFPDAAFELSEKASFDHVFDPAGPTPSIFYPGVALGPWSCLLTHPRFIKVCHRLGLCRYWLDSGAWPDCVAWVPFDFRSEVRRVASGSPQTG